MAVQIPPELPSWGPLKSVSGSACAFQVNALAPARAGGRAASAPPPEQIPGARRRAGDGEARERLLERRVRLTRRLAPGAVVEQHPNGGQRFEGGQRAAVGRLLLDRVGRQRDAVDSHRLLIDHRRGGVDRGGVDDRRLLGHVQLEEVVPAVQRVGVERVDVRAVGEREPLALCAREVLSQVRTVPAGLLVGPLARHVHGHLDLVDERDRRQRIRHRGLVVVVGADLREQVHGLAVQHLVGLARCVALLNPLVGPGLSAGSRGRLGVMDPLLRPCHRETGVEDPARIQRGLGVVDHRQGRDRGQAGGIGLGGEQLADPAIGDAHHPHLVMQHPRLARDRLDHVVAVEVLERLEEVVGAAGAAGAAHVDVDDRKPHQVGDDRDPVLGTGRVGVSVAGVLDQRRPRRPARRRRGHRHAGRQRQPGQRVQRRADAARQPRARRPGSTADARRSPAGSRPGWSGSCSRCREPIGCRRWCSAAPSGSRGPSPRPRSARAQARGRGSRSPAARSGRSGRRASRRGRWPPGGHGRSVAPSARPRRARPRRPAGRSRGR